MGTGVYWASNSSYGHNSAGTGFSLVRAELERKYTWAARRFQLTISDRSYPEPLGLSVC